MKIEQDEEGIRGRKGTEGISNWNLGAWGMHSISKKEGGCHHHSIAKWMQTWITWRHPFCNTIRTVRGGCDSINFSLYFFSCLQFLFFSFPLFSFFFLWIENQLKVSVSLSLFRIRDWRKEVKERERNLPWTLFPLCVSGISFYV